MSADITREVVRPEGMCMVHGCGNATQVQLLVVITQDGRRLIGAAGEFMAGWSLRHGLRHGGWIERCGGCFAEERRTESVSDAMRNSLTTIKDFTREPFRSITKHDAFCEYFGVGNFRDVVPDDSGLPVRSEAS